MAKGSPKERSERLKLNVTWQEAAARMLKVPAGSTPPRAVKPRKKRSPKRA